METLLSRRALFIGLLPRKINVAENADTIEYGQQVTKIIKTESFEMKIIARADKGCVMTSEQFTWYDPIENKEKFKMNNQIFICGEQSEI